jgi:hypothetical protein
MNLEEYRALRYPMIAEILPRVDQAAAWSRVNAGILLLGIHA